MEAPKSIPPLRKPDERERVPVEGRLYTRLHAGMEEVVREHETSRKAGDRFYVVDERGSALPVVVREVRKVDEDDGSDPYEIVLAYEPFPSEE